MAVGWALLLCALLAAGRVQPVRRPELPAAVWVDAPAENCAIRSWQSSDLGLSSLNFLRQLNAFNLKTKQGHKKTKPVAAKTKNDHVKADKENTGSAKIDSMNQLHSQKELGVLTRRL